MIISSSRTLYFNSSEVLGLHYMLNLLNMLTYNVYNCDTNKDNIANLTIWWLHSGIVELLLYLYVMVYFCVYFQFISYEYTDIKYRWTLCQFGVLGQPCPIYVSGPL